MSKAKPPTATEKMEAPDQFRVTIDPDIAAALKERSEGKKRGYASRLVNKIVRERLVQLRWLPDELTPEAED